MALQSYNIAVGNLTDDSDGNNYSVNTPVYITDENLVSVQIYKDLAGTIPIIQNGVDNTTDENGTFTFYVEDGQYIANVSGTNYTINVVGSDYFDSRIDEAIAEINEQNKIVLDTYGKKFNLITVFDFATGGTLETSNQCVRYTDGNSYQWQGLLPKTVNPGDSPSSPDWLQVTFNEIDNISGLRGELDDRAAIKTLTEIQSEDAPLGSIYILKDRDFFYGEVVQSTDTGGIYGPVFNLKKVRLIHSGNVTFKSLGYANDAGVSLNEAMNDNSVTKVSSKDIALNWITQSNINRAIDLDLGRSAITNNCTSDSCINVTERYTKVRLGYWDGNGKTSKAITSTVAAANLQINEGFGDDFAGQFIVTEGVRTRLKSVNVTNSQYDVSAAGAGCIRFLGQRSSINGLTASGNVGKSVTFDASRCTMKNFEIEDCLNSGSIGGIGFYTAFSGVNKFVLKNGSISKSGSHLIKVSGGTNKGTIQNVDLLNDSASVNESFENALCLLSGCSEVRVIGGTAQFNGTTTVEMDIFQITIHSTPDFGADSNRIENVEFIPNTSGQYDRLVNIVGSSGATKSTNNTIDGIKGSGFIALGAFAGDDGNTLQNSEIVHDGFATVSCNGGNGTRIINNPRLENLSDRPSNDDYVIRGDAGDDLTVSGNTLIGKSIGVRTNKTNSWVTGNNFKFPLSASVSGTIRYVWFATGATGAYANNIVSETVTNIGESLVTVDQNVIVNP